VEPKPVQLNEVNLVMLRSICQEYIDELESDNEYIDDDFEHYIFETAMKTVFGKDVFKWINQNIK
jgi:hypothetical protein